MALASGTLSLLKEAIGSTHQLVVDVEVTVGAAYLALWLTLHLTERTTSGQSFK